MFFLIPNVTFSQAGYCAEACCGRRGFSVRKTTVPFRSLVIGRNLSANLITSSAPLVTSIAFAAHTSVSATTDKLTTAAPLKTLKLRPTGRPLWDNQWVEATAFAAITPLLPPPFRSSRNVFPLTLIQSEESEADRISNFLFYGRCRIRERGRFPFAGFDQSLGDLVTPGEHRVQLATNKPAPHPVPDLPERHCIFHFVL